MIEKKDIIKEYSIIGKIGSGQFATVYNAVRVKDSKTYAIKVISKSALPADKQDYLSQEIFVLKSMKYENTVQLVDCAEWDDNVYIVMEYCEYNLQSYMIKKNYASLGMSEKEALQIFFQIVNGMNYLHTNYFIHRDIKLENILVTDWNGNIILKIADFGFSKQVILERNLAQNGTYVGTILYMSPEMLLGEAHNYKIDIWSLGIVLIQLLTGIKQFPFQEQGQIQIHKVIENHFQRNGVLNLEEIFNAEKIQEQNQYMTQVQAEMIQNKVKGISKECKDLIQKMMMIDFRKRIDTQEILEHTVLQQFQEVPVLISSSKLFYKQKLEQEFLFELSRCKFLKNFVIQIRNQQPPELIFPLHAMCFFLNKTQLYFLKQLKQFCQNYRQRQDLLKIGLEWWDQFEKTSNIFEILDEDINVCESDLKNNKENVLKEAESIHQLDNQLDGEYLKQNMDKQEFADQEQQFKACFRQVNELVTQRLRTIVNENQKQYKSLQIEIFKLMLKILTSSCIHSIKCDSQFIETVFSVYAQKQPDNNKGNFFEKYEDWINKNLKKASLFEQYQQIEQYFFKEKQQQQYEEVQQYQQQKLQNQENFQKQQNQNQKEEEQKQKEEEEQQLFPMMFQNPKEIETFDIVLEQRNVLEEYNNRKKIGKGSFSVVYSAEKNMKMYAIKVISMDSLEPAQKKYLFSEVFALKQMKNQHTVQLIDQAEWEGNLIIVMEYCEQNLKDYIDKKYGPLGMPEKDALEVFFQIMQGIQYLHTNNFIHRDIKLENILAKIQETQQFVIFKIGDFGFSKKTKNDNTIIEEGTFGGTKRYMAPEMLKGEKHNYKIDIWSLGVVLIQLLFGVGQFPFNGLTDIILMNRMKNHFKGQNDGLLNLQEIFNAKNIQMIKQKEQKKNQMNQEEIHVIDEREKKVKVISKDCIDLIQKMMMFDFKLRIDTQEILEHQVFLQLKEGPQYMQQNSKFFYTQKLENEYSFQLQRCRFIKNLILEISKQKPEIIGPQQTVCYFLNNVQLFFSTQLQLVCQNYRLRSDLFQIGLAWWEQFEQSQQYQYMYSVLLADIKECENQLKGNKQKVLQEIGIFPQFQLKQNFVEEIKRDMENQYFTEQNQQLTICYRQINSIVLSNLLDQLIMQGQQQDIELLKLGLKILTSSCINYIICNQMFISKVFCQYVQEKPDDNQSNLGSIFDNYDAWINQNKSKISLYNQYKQIEKIFFKQKSQPQQQQQPQQEQLSQQLLK